MKKAVRTFRFFQFSAITKKGIPPTILTVIQAFTYILYDFLMRENDVTPSNVMEMKTDVTKHQKGVRTALNNVTRFRPVNLLQNKTRFFSIAYIGALC